MQRLRSIVLLGTVALACVATTACVIAPPRARVAYYAPRQVWIPAHWQHGVWVRGHWR